MRSVSSRDTISLLERTYTALPLPIPQYDEQDTAIRVLAPDIAGRDRCARQTERQLGRDQLFAVDGNHPALLANHGIRLRALQDRRDLYRPKDLAGRHGSRVHLSDVRTILRRRVRVERDGRCLDRHSGREIAQARRAVLPSIER